MDWILASMSPGDRDESARSEPRKGEHAKALHKSLDCTIMDVADDIAYGVHDLEDAIVLGLVGRKTFERYVRSEACETFKSVTRARYLQEGETFSRLLDMLFGDGGERKRAVGNSSTSSSRTLS